MEAGIEEPSWKRASILLRPADDVAVRQDVAVGRDDNAAASAADFGDSATTQPFRRSAAHGNADDGRTNTFRGANDGS